jgi:hypothetical protein
MKKEKLDDSIKNKLSSYESAVPNRIWEGVSARLDEANNKKPAFWFLHRGKIIGAAASFLLASVLIGYQLNSNSTDSIRTEEDKITVLKPKELPAELDNVVIVDNKKNSEGSDQNSLTSGYVKKERKVARKAERKVSDDLVNNRNQFVFESSEEQEILVVNEQEKQSVFENVYQKVKSFEKLKSERLPSVDLSSPVNLNLFLKDKQCADFRETKNNLYWSLSYAQDFPIRKLESTNENLAAYVNLREDTEVFQNAFSINMNLGLSLRNGLNFRSGLIYSRLNEQFSHDVRIGTEVVIVQEVNENGTIIDSDTVYNPLYDNLSNTNLYETLDLPFIVGFEKSNEKFGMGFYTGLLVNLVFNKTGTIVSPINQDEIVTLTSSGVAGNYFNRNLGISYYASTMVTYKMNDRMQLKLEPYFRYAPKSFSNVNYMVNQSYYLFGGQVGLRYYL